VDLENMGFALADGMNRPRGDIPADFRLTFSFSFLGVSDLLKGKTSSLPRELQSIFYLSHA
jgi:hypothetical protein